MHCRNGSRDGRKWGLCTRGTLMGLQMRRWLLQDTHESWCQLSKLPQEWIQACSHCQPLPHTVPCTTQSFSWNPRHCICQHQTCPVDCGGSQCAQNERRKITGPPPLRLDFSLFRFIVLLARFCLFRFLSLVCLGSYLPLACKFYEGRTGIYLLTFEHHETYRCLRCGYEMKGWRNELTKCNQS